MQKAIRADFFPKSTGCSMILETQLALSSAGVLAASSIAQLFGRLR